MPDLPSHFEYQLGKPPEDRLGLYEFSYDDASKAFTVGSTAIKTTDFDPYRFTPHLLDGADQEAIDLAAAADYYALMPDFDAVIACPKLHTWVNENPDVLPPTREVMHRALTSVIDNPEEVSFEDDEHGFMGYAAHLQEYSGEPNSLHLQVIGNCACMGRGLYNLYIKGMEHGFAQYDMHNADLPAQRVGLYAGLGHLAKLAAENGS